MAGRDSRRQRLAPSFLVVAAAVGCGGTTSGVGEPDPYIATNPPVPSGGASGADGGWSGSGGGGGSSGFASGGGGGSSGFGANPVGGAVNPPAICPNSVPTDRHTGCNLWEQAVSLSCSYTTKSCQTLVAHCGMAGWSLSCQDEGGAAGAGGAGTGEGGSAGAD